MSERVKAMLKQLPKFMRSSAVYGAMFGAEADAFEARAAAVADLEAQLSVDTATWALSVYEAELGLPSDAGKPLTERRALVKSKLRGAGKSDETLLKLVVGSWTGGSIDVSFADGVITITFNDIVGIPSNMEDVALAVETIKPAHLGVAYGFLYNNWQQASSKTWGELEAYTWERVVSDDIF